jgi:hypothetical protein
MERLGDKKEKTAFLAGGEVSPSESKTSHSQNEQLLLVEIQKEFDVFQKTWEEKVFVKLYVAARLSENFYLIW